MLKILDERELEAFLSDLLASEERHPFSFHLAKVMQAGPGPGIIHKVFTAQEVGEHLPLVAAIARLSSDKFAVVQMRQGGDSSVAALADRISEQLARFACGNGGGRYVCIVASVDGAEKFDTPFQLMNRAELMLDMEKNKAEVRDAKFELNDDAKAAGVHVRAHALKAALDRGEFELFYQPITLADTTDVIQYEALIRWRDPAAGLIMPNQFIPEAEKVGVIADIGRWVLYMSCRQMLAYDEHTEVSVNLSPAEFLYSDVAATIDEVLDETGLHPRRLTIEVTENVSLDCQGQVLKQFQRISDMGVSISLDDFGCGYSSLSRLSNLPISSIKFDRSMIEPVLMSVRARTVISHVVQLAKKLQLITVAEGVETEDLAASLRDLSIDRLQGYHFGRPAPAALALRRQAFRPSSVL